MAKFDMSAQVDAILKRTNHKSLKMVCHSQGPEPCRARRGLRQISHSN